MERREKRKSLRDYAPQGTKPCEAKCMREPIMTPAGPVVVCHGCMRIVIDNRERGL
jgi:hypothetical protein